jgi:predicted TPR repeat methyltransferase
MKPFNTQFLLAQAQARLRFEQPQEAVVLLRELVSLESDHVPALQLLGQTLSTLGLPIEGARFLCQAYVLQSPAEQPPRMRGIAYYILGNVAQAREVYRQWTLNESDNPVASHFFAAFSGQDIPARASDGFIRETFDSYASRFDESLRNLEYRIPEEISALLARHAMPHAEWRVLDGGCGTGLSGPALRPWAFHLCGVDLSEHMVRRAQRLACYDQLVVAELTDFLGASDEHYELIAYADTLIYFGDLARILLHTAQRLSPGGWLVFNTELPQAQPCSAYQLAYSGRFQHDTAYITECLRAAGLQIEECVNVTVRQEFDQGVRGQLMLARTRPA